MAGEIYIADKPTLDLTKTNTDVIKTNTEIIKSQFPIKAKSPSDYTQQMGSKTLTGLQAGQTITLINYNGEGYLRTFAAYGDQRNVLKIELDGDLIFKASTQNNSSNHASGIFNMGDVKVASDESRFLFWKYSLSSNYRYTDTLPAIITKNDVDITTETIVAYITQQLYFKKSLKVTCYTKTSQDFSYYFSGGFLNP